MVCTPAITYLIASAVIILGFSTYNYIKHGSISFSGLSSGALGMLCCGFIINLLCYYSEIIAWVVTVVPLLIMCLVFGGMMDAYMNK